MKRECLLNSLLMRVFVISLIIYQSVSIEAAPGDLDLTFGIGGKVTTPLFDNEYANAVAIQTNGKIVVAGKSELTVPPYSKYFMLVRYNADGSLDGTFGSGGTVLEYEDCDGGFNGVALQTDGKIIAAGYDRSCYEPNAPYYFKVARYNTDGSPDTSFNGFGYTKIGFNADNCIAQSLALDSSGKIVAAGFAIFGSNPDFAVARLNSNGSLDTTFSSDGKATFPIGIGNDRAYSVAVHPTTGKIVLAGYSYTSSTSNDFALVMLSSNGRYDSGFGNNGKVTTDTGLDDRAYSVVFEGSKVIAAGSQSNTATGVDFSLVRYNSNGTLDASFGTGGKVKTAFGAYYDIAYGVSLQAGKIVAAGYGRSWNDNFAVARYDTNGSLDTTFNGDGKQMTDFVGYNDGGRAVAIQADGKILVAGYTFNGSDNDIAMARYLP